MAITHIILIVAMNQAITFVLKNEVLDIAQINLFQSPRGKRLFEMHFVLKLHHSLLFFMDFKTITNCDFI